MDDTYLREWEDYENTVLSKTINTPPDPCLAALIDELGLLGGKKKSKKKKRKKKKNKKDGKRKKADVAKVMQLSYMLGCCERENEMLCRMMEMAVASSNHTLRTEPIEAGLRIIGRKV